MTIAPLTRGFIFYFLTNSPMKYTIRKTRFGLYQSYDENDEAMVLGMTEEAVDWVTKNIHIPVLQGTFDGYTSNPRS